MGKGINGEPTVVKEPPYKLDGVKKPMKLNPETFKTEVEIDSDE